MAGNPGLSIQAGRMRVLSMMTFCLARMLKNYAAHLIVGGALIFGASHSGRAAEAKPNIVLILIDDLGWTDVGCFGNSWVETPAIDQLASEGVQFTDFYANGAVCSPTRAALQSGQYQNRFSLTAHIPGHWRPFEKLKQPPNAQFMPAEIVTVAEALKQGGYRTGYFGKWHLGSKPKHLPQAQGYDQVTTIGGSHFFPGFRTQPKKRLEKGTYQTEFIADEVDAYLESEAEHEAPFFAMVSPFAVHIPLQAKAEKIAKYENKPRPDGVIMHPVYAAMVEHVDDLVGRIVGKIDELGMKENTLVIFTSDNGGLYTRYDGQGHIVTSNAPLRDEKGAPYEGGVRIPTIVRFPGVAKAGAICADPAMSMDLYPTLLEAAEIDRGQTQVIDGESLLPLLKAPSTSLGREAVFWHYPHYHHSRPSSSVRAGKYKLIHFYDDDLVELYDLEADLGETRDLAAELPDEAGRIKKMLDAWRKETGSLAPVWNDRYRTDRAAEWWNKMKLVPIDLPATRESILKLPFDGPPVAAQPKAPVKAENRQK